MSLPDDHNIEAAPYLSQWNPGVNETSEAYTLGYGTAGIQIDSEFIPAETKLRLGWTNVAQSEKMLYSCFHREDTDLRNTTPYNISFTNTKNIEECGQVFIVNPHPRQALMKNGSSGGGLFVDDNLVGISSSGGGVFFSRPGSDIFVMQCWASVSKNISWIDSVLNHSDTEEIRKIDLDTESNLLNLTKSMVDMVGEDIARKFLSIFESKVKCNI